MSADFQNRLRKNLEHHVPVEHPAPDMLNAYAEHALTASEERQVTQHLSVCADCREVVYLATAVEEEEVPASSAPVKTSRVRWWAWAIPATAVIAVSAVLLAPLNRTAKMTTAIQQNAPEVATAPQATETNLQPESKAATAATKTKSLEETRIRAFVPAPKKEMSQSDKADVATEIAGSKGAAIANVPATNGYVADATAAPNQPPPIARNMASMQSARVASATAPVAAPAVTAAAKVTTQSVQVTSEAALLDNETPPQELPKDSEARDETRSYRAAPAMRLKKALPATSWMVNVSGQLTHLVNAHWQVVNPAAGPEPEFLSVASQGDQVWAAAKNLNLYYSPNNGMTWEKQTVPALGQNTEIVHLEFTSEVDGLLKLSDGEAFTTHDRGRNWVGVTSRR